MAHTRPTLVHANSVEQSLPALPQMAIGDADVVTALATVASRHDWLVVTNRDGSLRHVVPITELQRT